MNAEGVWWAAPGFARVCSDISDSSDTRDSCDSSWSFDSSDITYSCDSTERSDSGEKFKSSGSSESNNRIDNHSQKSIKKDMPCLSFRDIEKLLLLEVKTNFGQMS